MDFILNQDKSQQFNHEGNKILNNIRSHAERAALRNDQAFANQQKGRLNQEKHSIVTKIDRYNNNQSFDGSISNEADDYILKANKARLEKEAFYQNNSQNQDKKVLLNSRAVLDNYRERDTLDSLVNIGEDEHVPKGKRMYHNFNHSDVLNNKNNNKQPHFKDRIKSNPDDLSMQDMSTQSDVKTKAEHFISRSIEKDQVPKPSIVNLESPKKLKEKQTRIENEHNKYFERKHVKNMNTVINGVDMQQIKNNMQNNDELGNIYKRRNMAGQGNSLMNQMADNNVKSGIPDVDVIRRRNYKSNIF